MAVSGVAWVAMVLQKRRPALFAVLAAAMLLTSGAAGVAFAATPAPTDVQDEETPGGDEITEEFRNRIESLETVQFTRTEETTVNNETNTRVVSVAADLADAQKRVETLNATTGRNTTTVWNDTSVVTYYADENRVTEFEVTGTSLLPSVQGLANESLLSYEYRGTETVDGQETYVLEAVRSEQAPRNDDADASAMLYIDTETYFPVQTAWETSSEENSTCRTTSRISATIPSRTSRNTTATTTWCRARSSRSRPRI